jgi:hypothetical protein
MEQGEQRSRGSYVQGGARQSAILKLLYPFNWKSRLFHSTKKGERKQEREDLFKKVTKASPNYKAKSSRKLHQRRALSSLRFVTLFSFGFYLSSSKRGRLLRQHDQDILMF